jgi:hypothetical protein
MNNWGTESLLRRIAGSLAALRDEIHAAHEEHKADNANSKTDPAAPLIVKLSDPLIHPSVTEHYEAENRKRKSKWRWLKPAAETLGIISAFGLAIMALFTLLEVQKQTDAVTKSANAAADAVRLTRQQLKGTMAANVILSEMGIIGDQVLRERSATLTLLNNGHVIAPEVHATVTIELLTFPDLKPIRKDGPITESIKQGPVGQNVLSISRILNGWPEQRMNFTSQNRTVRLSGSYGFDNGFGDVIEAKPFCAMYLGDYSVTQDDGGRLTGGGGFDTCEHFANLVPKLLRWSSMRH